VVKKGKRGTSGMLEAHQPDRIAAAFDANYIDYQYIFVEFLIDHLVDVGRVFRGDYQAVLILAVLGQSRLNAIRIMRQTLPDSLCSEALADKTNASRISDITGIPRQTVRRKLDTLTERGWAERDSKGAYRLATAGDLSTARRDLSETDQKAMYRIARLVADLNALVERKETPV